MLSTFLKVHVWYIPFWMCVFNGIGNYLLAWELAGARKYHEINQSKIRIKFVAGTNWYKLVYVPI